MAIAVFALQVTNKLLHVIDIVVEVKLAARQRHEACVFPVGDVDLVVFQHAFDGVAQQGGVVSRQRRHDQHSRLVLEVGQGGAVVCKTFEAAQFTKWLVDLNAFMDGNFDAAVDNVLNAKAWLFVILAQTVDQVIASRHTLNKGVLRHG